MRNVLLTGATKGIGLAIAEKILRDDDCQLFACGRDFSSAPQLIAHPRVVTLEFDLAVLAQGGEPFDVLPSSLYGIVNNAGVCKTHGIADGGEGDPWLDVMAVNLEAPYRLVRALQDRLVNGGRIINISSQLGIEGRRGYSAYCASKFALNGLTKCWAKELGGRAITVNSVCPGWVETEMSVRDVGRIAKQQGKTYDEYYREICEPLELKRFTRTEEVANVVGFLLSRDGSGVTGRDWLLNTLWNQE